MRLGATSREFLAPCIFVLGCATASAQQMNFTLSGGPAATNQIVVDDEIIVSLNGAQIFKGPTAGAYAPVEFKAAVGDKLRVQATDTVGVCRSLSPLYLHVSGAPPRVLDKTGFPQVCDRPAGAPRLTFYDKTFPVVIGSGVVESITGFGTCGPAGPKMARWGRFGVKANLSSDAGEKLEIRCVAAGVPYFEFLYTPPGGGGPFRIGICPYHKGCNTAWFSHTGDRDNNGVPDAFANSFWISREYGNSSDSPDAFSRDNETPAVLDWAITFMDFVQQSISKIDFKFQYAAGPPVNVTCLPPAANFPEARFVARKAVDPLLGPDSEAFFDEVVSSIEAMPPSSDPMESTTGSLADLNGDGVKNSLDFSLFLSSYGRCSGSSGYNPRADLDGDGCVTQFDYQVWTQIYAATP